MTALRQAQDTARPALISWNLTRACNLRCAHCYLDARGPVPDELTTEECFGLLRQMEAAGTEMVILSGGEPLLRPDLEALVKEGSRLGLTMVLGTNGCLLDEAAAARLAAAGLRGAGISLDSVHPEGHDSFRGMPGAWEAALRGAAACRRAGIPGLLQATVLPWNCSELDDLVGLAAQEEAWGINFYFLVCTGRGETMTNITPGQYWQALEAIARAQARYPRIVVRARCAPQMAAIAPSYGVSGAGCLAGVSYARITPEGDLTPCPYLPLTVGDLRTASLAELWHSSPVFHALRHGAAPQRCQPCPYQGSCRGCRARAYVASGEVAGDDPWCSRPVALPSGMEQAPPWTPQAEERLGRVPSFLRPMVRRAVEGYACRQGYAEITPEVMAQVRETMGLRQPARA